MDNLQSILDRSYEHGLDLYFNKPLFPEFESECLSRNTSFDMALTPLLVLCSHALAKARVTVFGNSHGVCTHAIIASMPASGKKDAMFLAYDTQIRVEEFNQVPHDQSKVVNIVTSEGLVEYLSRFQSLISFYHDHGWDFIFRRDYQMRGLLDQLIDLPNTFGYDLRSIRVRIMRPSFNYVTAVHPFKLNQMLTTNEIIEDSYMEKVLISCPRPRIYTSHESKKEDKQNDYLKLQSVMLFISMLHRTDAFYIFSEDALTVLAQEFEKRNYVMQHFPNGTNINQSRLKNVLLEMPIKIIRLALILHALHKSYDLLSGFSSAKQDNLSTELEDHCIDMMNTLPNDWYTIKLDTLEEAIALADYFTMHFVIMLDLNIKLDNFTDGIIQSYLPGFKEHMDNFKFNQTLIRINEITRDLKCTRTRNLKPRNI